MKPSSKLSLYYLKCQLVNLVLFGFIGASINTTTKTSEAFSTLPICEFPTRPLLALMIIPVFLIQFLALKIKKSRRILPYFFMFLALPFNTLLIWLIWQYFFANPQTCMGLVMNLAFATPILGFIFTVTAIIISWIEIGIYRPAKT